MYPENDANERANVELVFGLTGGELERNPLRIAYKTPNRLHFEPTMRRRWIRYWYTGAPDYVERSYARLPGETLTVVADEIFGMLPSVIYAKGKRWRRVARYTSSGEAECWGHGTECAPEEATHNGRCPHCDAAPGEMHGYAYLGDGWGETVYYSRS